MKGASPEALDAEVARAAQACRDSASASASTVAGAEGGDGRLWVNDFWQAAVKHGAYGVHLGQEDLEAGGREALAAISAAGLRLGLSTHSYLELARATAVRPSYISLGPVFETTSKKVAFSPRGAGLVSAWRALVDVPLIAIGGISLERAPEVRGDRVGSGAGWSGGTDVYYGGSCGPEAEAMHNSRAFRVSLDIGVLFGSMARCRSMSCWN